MYCQEKVSVDVTDPLQQKTVSVSGQIQTVTNHRFQGAVDVKHLLVLQTFLVVHEYGNKDGLNERPSLSVFLKYGVAVGVIEWWFPVNDVKVWT